MRPRLARLRTSAALLAALLAALCALGACQSARLPEPGALRQLDAALRARASATAVLEDWCAARHLAADPRIHAEPVGGAERPAGAAVRRALQVSAREPVRHRRVRLRCGMHVLSVADNWYVPSRLTAAMNATLEATDEPFGRVVQPLGFHRIRLSTRTLWPPRAGTILEQRALLALPDGTPFSYVIEDYQRAALGGPA